METGAEQSILTVIGETVALGPLHPDHLPLYHRWLNDFAVVRTLSRPPAPLTTEQAQAWMTRHTENAQVHAFTVFEASTHRPVGNTALIGSDYRHRSAMFAILIGEATDRGRGFGTEATRLMLDYAFTARGLHSVWLAVNAYNLAGRRAYAKAGFQEVGRRRAAIWMGGTYWDEITMDCLATEFASLSAVTRMPSRLDCI